MERKEFTALSREPCKQSRGSGKQASGRKEPEYFQKGYVDSPQKEEPKDVVGIKKGHFGRIAGRYVGGEEARNARIKTATSEGTDEKTLRGWKR